MDRFNTEGVKKTKFDKGRFPLSRREGARFATVSAPYSVGSKSELTACGLQPPNLRSMSVKMMMPCAFFLRN
jgi:hypothetical protein